MHPQLHDACITALTPIQHLEKWQRISFAVLISITASGTLLLNTLVILSLFKTKQLNNTFNALILSLSVSECCMGVIGQTLTVVSLSRPALTCTFEMMAQFLCFFFTHVSGLLIMTTAVGRTVYMKYSKNIVCPLSKVNLCIILSCCLITAFLIGMSYTLATIHGNFHKVNIIILTLDFMFLLTSLLSYICLYKKIVNHVGNSSSISRTESVSRHTKHKTYSEAVSMTRIINRLIFMLCMSYIPYISVSLAFTSRPHICNDLHSNLMSTFYATTCLIVYVTPNMNAAIFLKENKKSKQFVSRFFSRKHHSSGDSSTESGDTTLAESKQRTK